MFGNAARLKIVLLLSSLLVLAGAFYREWHATNLREQEHQAQIEAQRQQYNRAPTAEEQAIIRSDEHLAESLKNAK